MKKMLCSIFVFFVVHVEGLYAIKTSNQTSTEGIKYLVKFCTDRWLSLSVSFRGIYVGNFLFILHFGTMLSNIFLSKIMLNIKTTSDLLLNGITAKN